MAVAALSLPSPALAHVGELASVALPLGPECPGDVVDESYVVEWFDSDAEEPEGFDPATIDWYATQALPPTFYPWDRPRLDGGVEVALDVPVADPANALVAKIYGEPMKDALVESLWGANRVLDRPK